MKFPVPHSFLHGLSGFEWLLCAGHWLGDCSILASAIFCSPGIQVCISIIFGEVSVVPWICEGHQPRGCFSWLGGCRLLLGESRLWVFQEMSDLPGFRVTDQLELRKGGRGEASRQPSFCLSHEPETDKPQPQTRPAVEASNRKLRTSGAPLPLKAVQGWVCVCVCPRLCARLFSLPLLFGGSGMQTELETTDLVVTREPDTGSTTLTVPRTSSDSNPGSDPTSPATLQIRLQVTTLFQKKKGFFSFWI